MNNRTNKIILFVLALVIIIFIVINKINFKTPNNDVYTIRYYDSVTYYLIYDMQVENLNNAENITVIEREEVICDGYCEPIERRRFTVPYKDEYKSFFKKQKYEYNNTAYLKESDLSESDYNIIEKILPVITPNKVSDYKEYYDYRVSYPGDYLKSSRGYTVHHHYGVEDDYADTEVTIYSGEKNTGGYSIEVVSVKKKDNDVIITVKEKTPGSSTVTMAITYPSVRVTLPFEAKNIVVKGKNGPDFLENTDNNY